MSPRHPWTRRGCLAALAASVAAGPAHGGAEPRAVALDWGWAATLVGLGARPAGVAEQRLYRAWVGSPPIPDGVPEVGLRGSPSFETLAALAPDLILTNGLDEPIRPRLERIAPVLPSPMFTAEHAPLRQARAAARLLGERLGRSREAAALLDDADARFARAHDALAGLRLPPQLPLTIVDRRHLALFGEGSLFADVLAAAGVPALPCGPTGDWGHVLKPVSALAELPPGDLLVVGPVPPGAADLFKEPGLAGALVRAAGRRVRSVPAAWGFGDISAAGRFADLARDALAGATPS